MAVVLIGAAAVVANPVAAQAAAVTGTVKTGGTPLNGRAEPKSGAALKATIKNGTKLTIACRVTGQLITGTVRKTDQWDRLLNGVYVADAYIQRTATVPACTTAAAPAPAGSAKWVSPAANVPAGGGFRPKNNPDHDGVDMSTYRNTPIRAVDAGVVIRVVCNASTNNCDVDGSPTTRGCGWYVEIQHANKVVTRYCHMIRRPPVTVGQSVTRGQTIGNIGSSGHSSGPHLHFEVHTNAAPATHANAVDPVAYLRKMGVTLPSA